MEHSKRMRACYSYKRKETFLSLNKIVFRNTGREILQDLISIQFLYVYDHTFSLFLSLSLGTEQWTVNRPLARLGCQTPATR